jgi:hypothetical protein
MSSVYDSIEEWEAEYDRLAAEESNSTATVIPRRSRSSIDLNYGTVMGYAEQVLETNSVSSSLLSFFFEMLAGKL